MCLWSGTGAEMQSSAVAVGYKPRSIKSFDRGAEGRGLEALEGTWLERACNSVCQIRDKIELVGGILFSFRS